MIYRLLCITLLAILISAMLAGCSVNQMRVIQHDSSLFLVGGEGEQ